MISFSYPCDILAIILAVILAMILFPRAPHVDLLAYSHRLRVGRNVVFTLRETLRAENMAPSQARIEQSTKRLPLGVTA